MKEIFFNNMSYIVATAGRKANAAEANSICAAFHNGSLASVTTQYLFDGITEQLANITADMDRSGFWVCGKVPGSGIDGLGLVGLTPAPSFQQGKI